MTTWTVAWSYKDGDPNIYQCRIHATTIHDATALMAHRNPSAHILGVNAS